MFWCTFKGLSSPSPYRKQEGIFLQSLLWEFLVGKTYKMVSTPAPCPRLGPAELFNSQTCPHWAPSSSSVLVPTSHPRFLPVGLLLQWVVILCSHLSIPSLGGSGWPCYLSSRMDLRIADFQFVKLFSWEDRSDDFSASNTLTRNQKVYLSVFKAGNKVLF